MALGQLLQRFQYEVEYAHDPADALMMIRKSAYDLIFVGMELPNTDSLDLLKHIRGVSPEPQPPIIAVTAISTRDSADKMKEEGFDAVLVKPISERSLRNAVLNAAGVTPGSLAALDSESDETARAG